MTKAATFSAIKSLGRELTVRCTDGEYRVSYAVAAIKMNTNLSHTDAVAKSEAMAYYTDCAQDAIDTAIAMHDAYKHNSNVFA